MPEPRDVVVIGAGPNGLVTAFYLARAGLKPLVLERRDIVGGCAITEEFHPGFKCSRLAHATWPLHPSVAEDMALVQHGLRTYTPDIRVLSLSADGNHLPLFEDPTRSHYYIAQFSPKDALGYVELQSALTSMADVLEYLLTMVPPDLEDPASGNLWEVVQAGRKLRGLKDKNLYRLLRWGPMAVADLAGEFFATDLLRGTIAAQGIFGTALGPRSAGSSTNLIFRAVPDGSPVGAASYAYGGIGAVTAAMANAVREAGGEIRTSAEVERLEINSGEVENVVLRSGEKIPAKAVVSSADPKRTLLGFVEPQHLAPSFLQRLQHYRMNGTVAKMNIALGGLPSFKGVDGNATSLLTGRILVAPEIEYLEHAFDAAKYGDYSRQPFLEATIPTLWDSSLAPAGKHVMSVYMQYAPYKLREGVWDAKRDELADAIIGTLAQYAPDLPSLIEAREVITPEDLEQRYGLTGGHIFHGELALDQMFTLRPLLGWSQYSSPIRNLYLCGSGTHPGTGLNGLSGATAARQIIKALHAQPADTRLAARS